MDIFVERIVKKKKDFVDYLIILVTILIAYIAAYFIIVIAGPLYFAIAVAFVVALGYLGYRIITSRNIEYEYSLANGDLEITKIVAKRKRKRMFLGNCRQFEMIDKVSSERHKNAVKNVITKINVSGSINSEDAYFFITNYNKEKVLIYFEPDCKILDSIKTFNRRAFE